MSSDSLLSVWKVFSYALPRKRVIESLKTLDNLDRSTGGFIIFFCGFPLYSNTFNHEYILCTFLNI